MNTGISDSFSIALFFRMSYLCYTSMNKKKNTNNEYFK